MVARQLGFWFRFGIGCVFRFDFCYYVCFYVVGRFRVRVSVGFGFQWGQVCWDSFGKGIFFLFCILFKVGQKDGCGLGGRGGFRILGGVVISVQVFFLYFLERGLLLVKSLEGQENLGFGVFGIFGIKGFGDCLVEVGFSKRVFFLVLILVAVGRIVLVSCR